MATLPPTVLLVEAPDDLAETLRERGYRVEAGEAADVARHRPDAVVVGGERALELLSAELVAAAPVLVLADRAAVPLALERGAVDCLAVPFDAAELDARLRAALRVKALHGQLVEANERLAAQALTDDLTGLANRRGGAHELERTVALATRHGHALALARVDVDHFKEINDTLGHQAGDRVLAEVARRLAGAVRGGDKLARWGGDEFVVVLPDTDRVGALRAAERLRAAVAETPVAVEGGEAHVTISVGWAHWSGDTPDDLLARADRSLYQAKDTGRDAVRPER
jgi:two-component system, cell cycle response regulator